jgi:hypothetical protein
MKKILVASLIAAMALFQIAPWGTVAYAGASNDSPSDWASADIDRAAQMGFLTADLYGKFTAPASRRDFCYVLAHMLADKMSASYNAFADTWDGKSIFNDLGESDSSEVRDIHWLNSLGVIQGVGNNRFNPSGQITRQEAAVLLARAGQMFGLSKQPEPAGSDVSTAGEWAWEGIYYCIQTGLMQGVGYKDGGVIFAPLGTYTREQAYITIVRLYDAVGNKTAVPPAIPPAAPLPSALNEVPANGDTENLTGRSAGSPFSVTVPAGDEYYYVILRNTSDNKIAVTLFVYAGKTVQINVPIGDYRMYYACGKTWHGKDDLFGAETTKQKADQILNFTADSGLSVVLIKQTNGNLSTSEASSSDFSE